jgi:hypothetical protein
MIKARHTYLATLLIMAFTTLFTVECRAAVLEQAAGYDVTHHATTEHEEIALVECDNNFEELHELSRALLHTRQGSGA